MTFRKIAVGLTILALMFAIPRFARGQADSYDVTGSSDSDMADAVVERREAELKTIPHVFDVETDEKDSGQIVIKVGVDKKKNVDEVARKVPARLEGFAVEVVPEEVGDGHAYAFSSRHGIFSSSTMRTDPPLAAFHSEGLRSRQKSP